MTPLYNSYSKFGRKHLWGIFQGFVNSILTDLQGDAT